MKKFDEYKTGAARGVQIWQILVGVAYERKTMTYGDLRKALGFGKSAERTLGNMLGYIYWFCKKNDLPPLTILVVNATTGEPGEGMIEGKLDHLRERVYRFNWYQYVPPTMVELSKAVKERK